MVWPGVKHSHEAVAVPGVRLAPGDALVQVELATVCGSDLLTVQGRRPAPTPLILGHEQVGTIVAVGRSGARATNGRRLSVGDRVVWSVAVPCGRCVRCRRGLSQKCLNLQKYGHERMRRGWELGGGFATHVHVLSGTAIVQVPSDMPSTVLAPASCASATVAAVLEAAAASVPLAGEVVVVAGAGMLGLTAAAMAKDAGAKVVVIEPDPGRRALALAFGADAVADPRVTGRNPTGILAAIARAGGRTATTRVALELSGAPNSVRTLLGLVDVGGVVVLAGTVAPGPQVSFDPEQFVRRMITVRGVHNYAPRHLERAVEFLISAWERYPFAEQVGEILPLDRVDDALALAAIGSVPRVGLKP
jgi:putative phosphonate catabolism associated alcohol dehydrogenase